MITLFRTFVRGFVQCLLLLLAVQTAPLAAAEVAGTPLWVTAVSHFDRPWNMTEEDLGALQRLSVQHPTVHWTHLYNPVAYTQETPLREAMERFVKRQQADGGEVGVHVHMYRSLVEAAGVPFRQHPSVSAREVEGSHDESGYCVPTTAYAEDEIAAILNYTVRVFSERSLGRPQTFCAGFYTTSVPLQRQVAKHQFTVSAAAFPQRTTIGKEYAPAWQILVGWEGRISHLTRPYWISATTILPEGGAPFLTNKKGRLLEVPQTCKIDWMVSADEMQRIFGEHYQIAKEGTPTAVCLAIHETSASEQEQKFHQVLTHIEERAKTGDGVAVRFVTCSELRGEWLSLTK